MSWRIRECYEFDHEERYETLDDLFEDIRDHVDSEEFDDDFEEHLNDRYGSIEVFGEYFDAAEVLRECGSYGAYDDARNEWFEDCLDSAERDCRYIERSNREDTIYMFSWEIDYVVDETPEEVIRVFEKDTAINSCFLWEIYIDKDMDFVEGLVKGLNDKASAEQRTVRWFIAEPGYHPAVTEVRAGL